MNWCLYRGCNHLYKVLFLWTICLSVLPSWLCLVAYRRVRTTMQVLYCCSVVLEHTALEQDRQDGVAIYFISCDAVSARSVQLPAVCHVHHCLFLSFVWEDTIDYLRHVSWLFSWLILRKMGNRRTWISCLPPEWVYMEYMDNLMTTFLYFIYIILCHSAYLSSAPSILYRSSAHGLMLRCCLIGVVAR